MSEVDFFAVQQDFGKNIYIASLIETLNNIGDVLNVTDLKFFNKVGGGQYSVNTPTMPYSDSTTKQLDTSTYQTIFVDYDEVFEIKFPNKDIKINFVF